MAEDELIKKFVDLHTLTNQLIQDQKVAEAKKKYLELLDAYHAIDKSSLEKFHKELAYDQVTKVFSQLNSVKESIRIPYNLIVAAVLIIALSFVVFLKPQIAGLASFEDEIVHPVNLSWAHTDVQSVILNDRPLTLSASGSFTGKVKLFYRQGERLELIFDSAKSQSQNGKFSRVCEETCKINTDSNLAEIFAQLDDKSSLTLTELVYKVERKSNTAPVWSGKTRGFTVLKGKTIILDLNQYFTDAENDPLVYLSTTTDGLDVSVENSIVTITAKPGATGTKSITFIASDLAEVTKIPVAIVIK